MLEKGSAIPLWDMWQKGFDAWEASTARVLEQALKSPLVLEPAGALLTVMMEAKAASDQVIAGWWRTVGLATRGEQDRAMHAVNQLHSRLIDVEEQLQDR